MQGRSDAAAGRRVGVLLSPPCQEVGAGGVQDEGGLLECGGGEYNKNIRRAFVN